MKLNHLKKITSVIALIFMANYITHAQSCISTTSHNITEIYNNGDGSSDYEIDLCAEVNGSPRPKRIVFEVYFDTDGNGTDESKLTYEFDPPGNHIANGTYCLSSMQGDESFVVTIPSGDDVKVEIIGYKSNSGSNGGKCENVSANVSTASLPVELVDFNAKAIDKEVLLQWTTASEIDHDYFAVEQSVDGEDYKELGRIENEGDSYELKKYSFTDTKPATGDNFYRLRQVDLDGHIEFSSIRGVKIAKQTDYSIYPTFAREQVTLRFEKHLETELAIRVIDMSGKLVKETHIDRGQETVTIETFDLVTGTYLVAFEGEQLGLKTGRFVKVG